MTITAPNGAEFIIAEPSWLYVMWIPTPRGRALSVYRSLWLQDEDDLYLPVLALVGDTEPYSRSVVPDPSMMFQQAEELLFEVDW